MLPSNRIVRHLLNKAADSGNYSSDELDMIRYSAESILWEVEKVVILLLLFLFLGKGSIYVVLLLILFCVRSSAGGYHCTTYWGCLLFSLCIFLGAIILLPLLPIGPGMLYGAAWVCVINTAVFAPVCSEQKELFQTNPIQKKILAILLTSIWLFILRFFDQSILISGLYLIILQNFQLTISYFIKKRTKKIIRESNADKHNGTQK